eukprot:Clim_evm24s230 gene=Clim_evmTU24s230
MVALNEILTDLEKAGKIIEQRFAVSSRKTTVPDPFDLVQRLDSAAQRIRDLKERYSALERSREQVLRTVAVKLLQINGGVNKALGVYGIEAASSKTTRASTTEREDHPTNLKKMVQLWGFPIRSSDPSALDTSVADSEAMMLPQSKQPQSQQGTNGTPVLTSKSVPRIFRSERKPPASSRRLHEAQPLTPQARANAADYLTSPISRSGLSTENLQATPSVSDARVAWTAYPANAKTRSRRHEAGALKPFDLNTISVPSLSVPDDMQEAPAYHQAPKSTKRSFTPSSTAVTPGRSASKRSTSRDRPRSVSRTPQSATTAAPNDGFVPITDDEFEGVSQVLRSRLHIAEVNAVYRKIWELSLPQGRVGMRTGSNRRSLRNVALAAPAVKISLKDLSSEGLKVTGVTGQAKLKVLRQLGVIKLDQNFAVTLL